MAVVNEILKYKGSLVFTIPHTSNVLEAAKRMVEHQIGSLVVLGEKGLIGIFTERDILRRVVAQQRDPATTRVTEVMSSEIVCCRLNTSLDEARGVMMNRRIRHLPVVDDQNELLGLISIGDLNAHDDHAKEQTIYLLHQYIYQQR